MRRGRRRTFWSHILPVTHVLGIILSPFSTVDFDPEIVDTETRPRTDIPDGRALFSFRLRRGWEGDGSADRDQ